MDAVDRAFEYYKNFKEKHPHLKEEVEDLYYLFLAEIEDECASKQHEYGFMRRTSGGRK